MSHFLSCLFTATISGLPASFIIIVIIIIIIIISFITVFADVLFVHQPGTNHAPIVSFTQVNHSVHTLSTFPRIREDPSLQIFWISAIVALSDTFLMFFTIPFFTVRTFCKTAIAHNIKLTTLEAELQVHLCNQAA